MYNSMPTDDCEAALHNQGEQVYCNKFKLIIVYIFCIIEEYWKMTSGVMKVDNACHTHEIHVVLYTYTHSSVRWTDDANGCNSTTSWWRLFST